MSASCGDCWSRAKGSVARYRELLSEHPENQPVLEYDGVRVYAADCYARLRMMPDNSVHAIVTDPPYGLADHKPATIVTALTAWANGDREKVPDGKGFMGRAWDSFVPPPAVWDECLRVLKPGGHMLVFAGTRTVDLMGLSIRLAGFELRDSIGNGVLAWVQGQGFPKGKAQLKPAWEPILMARKPLSGTVAATVLEHGTGAINVDACRVDSTTPVQRAAGSTAAFRGGDDGYVHGAGREYGTAGRWPTNVVLTHGDCTEDECQPGCPVAELNAQAPGASRYFPTFLCSDKGSPTCPQPGERSTKDASTSAGKSLASTGGNLPTGGSGDAGTGTSPMATKSIIETTTPSTTTSTTSCASPPSGTTTTTSGYASITDGSTESSSASASGAMTGSHSASTTSGGPAPGRGTASPASVHTGESGWDGTASSSTPDGENVERRVSLASAPPMKYQAKAASKERPKVEVDGKDVGWPTVKPLALMRWLVRLVTPPGGVVLDPFAGSGTTAQAAAAEGFECVLIERDELALRLIHKRLTGVDPGSARGGVA